MTTLKKQLSIDKLNIDLWQGQYTNPFTILLESKKVLKDAERLGYEKGIAYARLNIAKASFLQSKNKEAFEALTDCLSFFYENPEEPGYPWVLNLQGNMLESIGDYEKGLELCLKAFKRAKERDDLVTEAESASVLGLIYTRLCNFNKALEFYHKALKIREELGDEDAMASSLNRIGMIHRLVKEYDESLNYYQKSLEIRERKKLTGAIPWTLLGLASTYEEMGQLENAQKYYTRGVQDFDKRCVLQCKLGLGRVYSRQGKNKLAEQSLLSSLEMANELNAKPLVAEVYSALAKHYEAIRDQAKALESYKKYQQAKEAVLSDEAQNRLWNIEISHAIEKSEQEKEIYRLKHVELKAAYDIIDEKNKQITSSISYASYIQQAILPELSDFKGLPNHCFVFYQPKDIISGDFYWFAEKNGKLILVAADCTGHGVPGALMSMLGISLLNEIINEQVTLDAGKILDALRAKVIESLHQAGREKTKDGMDITLCILNRKKYTMQFAGAHNSLCLVRNSEVIEYKADPMPIGIHQNMDIRFTRNEIYIQKGDMLYFRSDGFQDQFGGPDRKKFLFRNLKELFLEIHKHTPKKQREILEKRFLDWKGIEEQIDDVLILGYRV